MIVTNKKKIASTAKKKQVRRVSIKPPEHVLVEVSADGFIEVFAADNVRVHIFNRLCDGGSKLVNDVDEFHRLDIPRPYRNLYFPRHVRATGLVEKRTIEGEYLRREKLQQLCEYQQLANDIKKGDICR